MSYYLTVAQERALDIQKTAQTLRCTPQTLQGLIAGLAEIEFLAESILARIEDYHNSSLD